MPCRAQVRPRERGRPSTWRVARALLLAGLVLATGSPAAAAPRSGTKGQLRPTQDEQGERAACATAPLRTAGPVFYYCDCQAGAAPGCVVGDDAHPGTSPDAPRRTVASARAVFNGMSAGSTVAFCRGGAFAVEGPVYLHNIACRADSTCDWRDYAPPWGGTAAPIFAAGPRHFLWLGTPSHEEGFRFWNLDVRHEGGEGISFWLSADVTDVDICNITGSGGDAAGVLNPYVARVTFRSSRWSRYAKQGVLAGADDLVIDSNVFTDVGAARGPLFHSIYLGGGGEPGAPRDGYRNERITNNVFQLGSCNGTVIVLHGRHVDTVIRNNRIVAENATGGCYGIQASHGGYPYGSWFKNLSIQRNRISLAGGGEGISLSNCVGCVVTDNSVALTSRAAGHRAISISDAPARSREYADEAVTTDATVLNNSVYVASTGFGVYVGSEGKRHIVQNNAIWTNGPACTSILAATERNSHNYCRAQGGSPASAVFVDAAAGDLRPVRPGPLVGRGSTTHYSASALSPAWSAADEGVPRAPPVDAGAFGP